MFIKKRIGKELYTFVVEGKNFHEVIMESQKLSFPDIAECGICGSDDIFLNAREVGKKDEFEYTEIRCKKCKAQLVFGKTKADSDVFFLRKVDKMEKDGKTPVKDANGKAIKVYDWTKYNPDSNQYGNVNE
jgi:hypothetical protein